ncbi:MAG: hypothetical protein JWM04_1793 [Verrucomicrobiales bacterium]|nr:hypothetical protein [Verrucomicrobiales bacterium]
MGQTDGMNRRLLMAVLSLAISLPVFGQLSPEPVFENVKRQPPLGIAVSDTQKQELQDGLKSLRSRIDALKSKLKGNQLALLPDVEIFYTAVRYPLEYNEFFKANEITGAANLLKAGMERAEQLDQGKAPWLSQTGLVVRGYQSKIDKSYQPYGLVVPPSFVPNGAAHRLDLWFHGRGETLTELSFLMDRMRSYGEFTPADSIVLHLYGRYCNGDKFAGETDTFEAMEHVKKYYPIDENRILARGFSLGGAAAWHMAAHHAGLWVAAAPGAGFSESQEFLRISVKPPWYEQKLWHLYDATDYALNLFNCPTIAYSGEIDGQAQAALIMQTFMDKEGLALTHIRGPKTGHSYEANAKKEIIRRLDIIAAKGRNPVPNEVKFTTWTLRYNQMLWVQVDAMEKHWERALVDAKITGSSTIEITTKNVNAITLQMPPGYCPLDATLIPKVIVDGKSLQGSRVDSDKSWTFAFHKEGSEWQNGTAAATGLTKKHGLQGPIDDAFMDSFVMVVPTGTPMNETTGKWVEKEQTHAIEHWRRHFRGDAQVVKDTEVTDDMIKNSNLVLWGDPQSNAMLKKMASSLPLSWTTDKIGFGGKSFPAGSSSPVMIYPNPLNPARYVVLNSGFTFREYDYLNNARQTPKLPDFAIIDVSKPVTAQLPGDVLDAGFFNETWKVDATRP